MKKPLTIFLYLLIAYFVTWFLAQKVASGKYAFPLIPFNAPKGLGN